MASWIVHLRIAERLLGKIDGLDPTQFAIANVAPDSGIPDEKWEKFDPPAEILHFQSTTSKPRRCNDLDFYRDHLQMIEWPGEDVARFSFYLGYFFHLIVDNLWGQQIGIPAEKLYENKHKADFEDRDDYLREVKRDWYGLDFVYVRDQPKSIFWHTFLDGEVRHTYLDFLPEEALKQRVDYIKNFYQREDEAVKDLMSRPWIFLSKERMDAFVEETAQTLYQIFDLLWFQDTNIGDLETVLELMP